MADKIEVTSPVKIESDSKSRVAFDFMNKIVTYTATDEQKKDKNYWFTIYRQCYKAADGLNLQYIVQEN